MAGLAGTGGHLPRFPRSCASGYGLPEAAEIITLPYGENLIWFAYTEAGARLCTVIATSLFKVLR